MKISKNLIAEVKNDFVPLSRDAEGQLKGGFGSVTFSGGISPQADNNCYCGEMNNCSCPFNPATKQRNNCNCPYDKKADSVYTPSLNNCECNSNNCNCRSASTKKSSTGVTFSTLLF